MSSISIVIPVYNEEDHIKSCLKSIASQTRKPDEVIVVDNNSTDRSAEIASSFPFVKLIREPKQGVTNARTTGFDAVSKKIKIIGRIDADTILRKNWVERVIKNFKDPKLMAVTGPAYFHDMPFAPHNFIFEHMFKAPLNKLDKEYHFLFGSNMAITNQAWQQIKPELCNEPFVHEDMDIAIHLGQEDKKISYDPKLVAGISARRADDNPRDFLRYMNLQRTTFLHHGLDPVGARVAMTGYVLGYTLFSPLRRMYDPVTKQRSLKNLWRGNKPRKNPLE